MKSVIVRCVVTCGAAAFLLYGCDEAGEGTKTEGTGGKTSVSGGSGGSSSTGGTSAAGGAVSTGGSVASGGTSGTGGSGVGGASATGGRTGAGGGGGGGGTAGTGGGTGSGGRTGPDGGAGTGGATGTGGRASGGATSSGGASGTGGATATGGTRASGGATGAGGATGTGGRTGTGGSAGAGGGPGSGGSTGPCTPVWEDPPSNVSAWIDASWNEQLGANVKSRKAWLLDNVMLGKGEINLCVRWGATSAPSDSVKSNMASSAEKWFNDWFSKLSGYACFPYSQIKVKVTGWAVKPGNEAWVSGLDSSIKVYTETDRGTDPPNEPKCPDACSFFTNWSHSFPNCPGGEAFHHDYWMWLDDNLPGSGAAAVGGDWGLRMPVSSFTGSMGKSNMVIEHEMGHGYGFQDYYDWPSSSPTPSGGSIMIVGSTSSQTPTVGDQWLLRRTWKEMVALRGW